MFSPRSWLVALLLLVCCGLGLGEAEVTEEDFVRALLASREAQEHSYMPESYPMMHKRRNQAFSAWAGKRGGRGQQAFSSWAGKRAPFSSWAGKRSGQSPVYHQMPEYVRRKRSSEESSEAQEAMEKRGGSNRFARAVRESLGRPVKDPASEVVFRPQRATFSAWGGR